MLGSNRRWEAHTKWRPCGWLQRRALGYLIYKYLQHAGYKLTAVTFADETHDQDLDDWV